MGPAGCLSAGRPHPGLVQAGPETVGPQPMRGTGRAGAAAGALQGGNSKLGLAGWAWGAAPGAAPAGQEAMGRGHWPQWSEAMVWGMQRAP